MKSLKKINKKIDLPILVFPLIAVIALFFVFMIMPEQSTTVLDAIRGFLGNDMGLFYILMGLGTFFITMYIAFSKYGKIKLGKIDKPLYSNFKWGAMIFTSTLAADIIFYSICEWAMYANESHVKEMGSIQDWASTYPLFHWGPIAWSFYILLAAAFGFMMYIRGRKKQRFSEACRPILGDKVDSGLGRIIDVVCIVGLIWGTATTF